MNRILLWLGLSVGAASLLSAGEVLRPQAAFSTRLERLGGYVLDTVVTPDGKFFAAGTFSSVGASAERGLARFNADGTPDFSFAAPSIRGGTVGTMAVQPDGKLVLGGTFTEIDGFSRQFIARLHIDGSLDASFGAGPVFDASVESIAVRGDGRLVVAGSFTKHGTTPRNRLALLLPSGELDGAFPADATGVFRAGLVAAQADGKILVAGSSSGSGGLIERLIRLQANGSRDVGFVAPFNVAQGGVRAMTVLPDGKIIVGGFFPDIPEYIVRLNASGSRDSSFNAGSAFLDEVRDLAVDSEGRIVATSLFSTGQNSQHVRRFLANGSVDTSFVPQNVPAATAYSVACLPDGRYLLGGLLMLARISASGAFDATFAHESRVEGGILDAVQIAGGGWSIIGDFTHVDGVSRPGLARLQADGSLDAGFVPPASLANPPSAMLAEPDGSIVVSSQFAAGMQRYTADGALDPTFAATAMPNGVVNRFLPQPDGRILVGGTFTKIGTAGRGGIARLLANGELDSSFNPGAGFTWNSGFGEIRTLTLQSDGRIIVTGRFTAYNGTPRIRYARLHADGALDTGFSVTSVSDQPPFSVAARPDGRLLLAGNLNFTGVWTPLAQLNADGSPDSTFVPAVLGGGTGSRVLLRADGKFWAWGSFVLANQAGEAFARFRADGSLDAAPRIYGATPVQGVSVLTFSAAGELVVGGSSSFGSADFGTPLMILEPAAVPIIEQQPASQTAAAGATVTFNAAVTGPDLQYQWFKDDVSISGATSASLVLANVQWGEVGAYRLRISNPFDIVWSEVARLSGINPAPTINTQPGAIQAREGSGGILTVSVTGVGALAYQWRRSGQPILGATGSSLALESVQFSDDGFYDVVVADGLSFTTSSVGRIVVVPANVGDVLRAIVPWGPRLEKGGGRITAMLPTADGKVYIAGDFSGLAATTTARLARFNADGSVDASFAPALIHDGAVQALTLQADGKLVIGGTFTRVAYVARDRMARLNADGSLDPTFTTGTGFAVANLNGPVAVSALLVLPGGEIVVGGDFSSYRGVGQQHLMRVLADGTADAAFVPPGDIVAPVRALQRDAEGRILVGGRFGTNTAGMRKFLLRMSATGARDDTFTSGELLTGTVEAIALQPDGRLLIGGDFNPFSSNPGATLPVVRLNADGSLDASFAPDLSKVGVVRAVSVLPGGDVLVAGRFTFSGASRPHALVRLTAAGAFVHPYVERPADAQLPYTIHRAARLADGTIFSALEMGDTQFGGTSSFACWRFQPDGTRDESFTHEPRRLAEVFAAAPGPAGVWAIGGDFKWVNGVAQGGFALLGVDGTLAADFTPGTAADGRVYALAWTPDGKIILGGSFEKYQGQQAYRVARVRRDGSLDSTFLSGLGTAGTGYIGEGSIRALALQPDGKLVVGGDYFGNSEPRVQRLEATGALDGTFNPAAPGLGTQIRSLAVQRDGHVIVGGVWTSFGTGNSNGGLVRLRPDGSQDTGGNIGSGYAVESVALDAVLIGTVRSIKRMLPDGSHDPLYGSVFLGPHNPLTVEALATDADGRTLFGGDSLTDPSKLVERALSSSELDPALRVTGVFSTTASPAVHVIRFGPGGAILVGGRDLEFENGARGGLVMVLAAPVPAITAQPVSQTAVLGATVTFSVTATGENLQYQWKHDGVTLSGATGATLTLTNVGLADVGIYTVVITNVYDLVVSDPATLSGINPAPVITTHPETQIRVFGETASFQVGATGVGPLTYQWRKFGHALPGENAATLAVANLTAADAGFFDVVVADGLSVTVSGGAELQPVPTQYPNVLRPVTTFAPRFERQDAPVAAIAALADGRYYAAGSIVGAGEHATHGIARFLANGDVDTTFQAPAALGATRVRQLLALPDGGALVVVDAPEVAVPLAQRVVRVLDNGALDTTFAADAVFNGPVHALARQSDGRVVVGGVFTAMDATPVNSIVRLGTDGMLDPAFQFDPNFEGAIRALAVQADGRVLVGGHDYSSNPVLRSVQADGAADASFVMPFGNSGFISALIVQPDGRILVGASSVHVDNQHSLGVVRLETNGALDATFVVSGSTSQIVDAIALRPDGKIIVAAISYSGARLFHRLNANGTPDATFAAGAGFDQRVDAIASLSDGTTLAGGSFSTYDGQPVSTLVRVSETAGLLPWSADLREAGVVLAFAPAAGGKWLVGGSFTYVNRTRTGGIARLDPDGSLDTTFQTGEGFDAEVTNLVVQGDGRILVGGDFANYNGVAVPALVRLRIDGSRDAGFTPDFAAHNTIQGLGLQSNGRILVTRLETTQPSGAIQFFLNRLVDDGGLDPVFTWHPPAFVLPSEVMPAADGSSLIGGIFADFGGTVGRNLVRLRPDGTPDPAFQSTLGVDDTVAAFARLNDGSVIAADIDVRGEDVTSIVNRLRPDGSWDTSYGDETIADGAIFAVRSHHDGRVLITGDFTGVSNLSRPVVARLTASGAIDAGFAIPTLRAGGSVSQAAYTVGNGLALAGSWLQFGMFTGRGFVLLEPVPEPVIITQPQTPSPTQAGGGGVALVVDAVGNGEVTYQWQVDYGANGISSLATGPSAGFVNVPGATGASLSFPVPQTFHRGFYRVVITANGASVTSDPITVSVAGASPSPAARLLNLSTRALVQTGDNVLIPGFVVAGDVDKKLLIRAVGPTLGVSPFNVPGVLPDPRIVLKRRNPATQQFVDVANNDNWGTNPNFAELKQTAADLFAFGIPDASKDAALLLDLTPGEYTVIADDVMGATGIAIVELYDADATGAGSRLANISNRGFVGVGANVMIPGFVVSSEGPKTFLIRVVGPTLGGFGVAGTMADPKLTVFRSNSPAPGDTEILNQDNWSENPDATYTAQIAQQVLAFPFASGTKDAAFVVTLPPGLYTVHGKSADGTSTGVVLVEVYVVE